MEAEKIEEPDRIEVDYSYFGLLERIVKVEEELKHQRELMKQGFEAMDKRFEMLMSNMDKRFEAMDKSADKRFEAMDKNADKRFEAIDKRFEAMDKNADKRFEAIDKRFEAMDKRFNMLMVLVGGGFTLITVLITIYKFIS